MVREMLPGFLSCRIIKDKIYKLFKNVKLCKKMEISFFQVFHNETLKKGGKITVFTILSTFSTLIVANLGDYSSVRKERMFCEEIIKIRFCRKKMENGLTSKKSNIRKKFYENVYTMIKSDYNGNTEEKRRR